MQHHGWDMERPWYSRSIPTAREEPIRHAGKTTVTALGERLARPLRICELWLVHGATADGRTRLELGELPMALGREAHPDGGWVFADPEVSRLHAVLERDMRTEGWILVDKNSRNGTWVDGRRVDRMALSDGAVLRLGGCVLVYRDAIAEPGPLEVEAPPLLGPSREMQRVRGDIGKLSAASLPVLVVGETGTGKERVAEQLHARSGRKGAFVPVRCATLPREHAEVQLFGRAAGPGGPAVTGHLVEANGGTLFLDEVEALPIEVQAQLLRAVEGGEVRPVGTPEVRRVDVRVVCGALRPLEEMVRQGAFRADLLARLSAWTLFMPPLRARREDVVPIARALLRARGGTPTPVLSADAAEALSLAPWPYNVRQLEQVVQEALVRGEGADVLRAEHLPPDLSDALRERAAGPAGPNTPPPVGAGVPRMEGLSPRMQQTLECLLAGASEKEVAAKLGLSSHTVHDYVKKLYRHFRVSSRAELLATVLGRR
jgi:DNA-binding NtrC family response regulator